MGGRWILLLLMLFPGVASDWGVTYKPECALSGSTAVIKCSYDYPWGHIVTSVTWYKGQFARGRWEKKKLDLDSGRFEYAGNKGGKCDLKIQNIQYSDEGRYYFSFRTTLSRWNSQNYGYQSVSNLTAVVEPSTATEGDKVRLSCRSGCATSSGQVWFKDGKPVRHFNFPASRVDSGRYHCSLLSGEATPSLPVQLRVLYAPVNVELKMIPTQDMVNGSSVTLSCSSDANPPVSAGGYSMYRDGHQISSGESLTITVLEPGHSGQYHCRAQNNISRAGEAFTASADVELDVKYAPVNVSISPDPAYIQDGSPVNLTCSSDANPPANRYTWFLRTSSAESPPLVQVGSGPWLSLSSEDARLQSHYLCRAGNHLGERSSAPVRLMRHGPSQGDQTVFILAGIGACLLSITALLFWYKKRKITNKNAHPSGDISPLSSIREDSVYSIHSNVYANIGAERPRLQRKTRRSTVYEADIMYTTVNFKPRISRHTHGRNVQRSHQQPLASAPETQSVVYSTVGVPS